MRKFVREIGWNFTTVVQLIVCKSIDWWAQGVDEIIAERERWPDFRIERWQEQTSREIGSYRSRISTTQSSQFNSSRRKLAIDWKVVGVECSKEFAQRKRSWN